MHSNVPAAPSRTFPIPIGDLATPALLLDRGILESNIGRMRRRAAELGVGFRPHLKTAKSIEVARLAQPDGGPITVSTLAEAEYFSAHGYRNLLYAVSIAPAKLGRVASLVRAGTRVLLAVDHPAAAAAVRAGARRLGCPFEVLIEIDSGEARAGVPPDSPVLESIADALGGGGVAIAGVFTHGGHSYGGRTAAAHAAVAEAERRAVTRAADRLRALGHPCEIVSLGSSPGLAHARSLEGVTEIRAGVAMFGDLFQAGIGACARADIALTVLATVIGVRTDTQRLIVDAGSLALSKDRSTEKLGADGDCGYGLVAPAEGGEPFPGWKVETVYQEHGMIASTGPIDFDRHPIGSLVRILPNHSCLMAAAYGLYHVRSGGPDIEAVWYRVNGW